jgi:hypothetical protein
MRNQKKSKAKKEISLSQKHIKDMLLFFINKNIEYFAYYINPGAAEKPIFHPKMDGYEAVLIEYIDVADKEDPENFKILQDLVMGSIISVLLQAQDAEEIAKFKTGSFKNCKIFLDTNFVFSIFGLHDKVFSEPAIELLELLRNNNFELKVFSFTITEINKVIDAYCSESYRYPSSVRVDTLYSALKRKDWTKTQAREFIMHIEANLQEFGISVEWVDGVNLKDYVVSDERRQIIKTFKPFQTEIHQNHDLIAIDKIKEIRKKPVRAIEEAKALFLTSDIRLSKYNFEIEHKDDGTICEVVSDRLLTNILWLKNPNIKLSLKPIIAAHSRDLFVNRHVWDKFYNVLTDLKKTGKVKEDDISTLFWHSYIEDSLRSVGDINSITPEFILEEIEKAGEEQESEFQTLQQQIKVLQKSDKSKEEEVQKKEAELRLSEEELQKQKEFSRNIIQSLPQKIKSETDQEWLTKIEATKRTIRKNAERRAFLIVNTLRISIIIVLCFAIFIANFYNVPLATLSFVFAFLGFGGVIGIWKMGGKTKNWLTQYIYNRKLKASALEKIQT